MQISAVHTCHHLNHSSLKNFTKYRHTPRAAHYKNLWSIFVLTWSAKTIFMKKILFSLLLLCIFVSCQKELHFDAVAVAVKKDKIYYQGSAAGTIGWEEIFVMNEDGSEQQLTDFSGRVLPIFTGEPVLSPDGKKIYFNSKKDFAGGEVFSMNIDGSGVTKIISNNITGSALRDPFLFQNGQKIVYCMELDSFANRHGEIFTADINGGNRVSLINYPAEGNCYHPCVNPANTTIVYSNLFGGKTELYAMNIDGSNKRALTSTGSPVKFHPQFSPDGTKIVFDGLTGRGTEIFIMDAGGNNITQLTNYTNNGTKDIYSWGPTFSKDGKTIYFSSDEFDGYISQLYKMNIDGTGKVKLTSSAVDKFNPCVK